MCHVIGVLLVFSVRASLCYEVSSVSVSLFVFLFLVSSVLVCLCVTLFVLLVFIVSV